MRQVEFRQLLDEANALRVQFEIERDEVLRFVVQLECRLMDEWQAVVRYDTAHDFAHRDLMRPSGQTEKMELSLRDYNEALTFAIADLKLNWQNYRERYEAWMKSERK